MAKRGQAWVFRDNLRKLTLLMGLTPTKVAKAISKQTLTEFDPRWYRRLCRKGIRQAHKESRARLEAIARFFGVTTVNHLWNERLITFSLSKQLVPPRESEYTVKLVELLETGKHDYLRQLISSLYALEFPSGNQSHRSATKTKHIQDSSTSPTKTMARKRKRKKTWTIGSDGGARSVSFSMASFDFGRYFRLVRPSTGQLHLIAQRSGPGLPGNHGAQGPLR